MKIFLTISIALLCWGCSENEQITAQSEVAEEETNEQLYLLYCAQCHGANGDGKALIALDRPARSFIDGGFSFGNTLNAISKTTASGIPGTPMPPFADILTEEQIQKIAIHVRNFAPTQRDATPNETEMVVSESPLVIRGMLPPLNSDSQLHPRGLLIGNTDRFSYEYRADDVRLLAVRQGQFVRRDDWGERGGSPIVPLGNVVVYVNNGSPAGLFKTLEGNPLKAQLRATNTAGKYAFIRYELITDDGKTIASIEEWCRPTTGTRALIEQHFEIDAFEPFTISPPPETNLSVNANILPGKSKATLTHALYGGDSK